MERFILQPSQEPGFWVATDTVNGIVVKFKDHEFNETQEVTLLGDNRFKTAEEAMKYATYIRELADWLRDNHYCKVFYVSLRDQVGMRIRELRVDKGLTGDDLAKMTGLSKHTISKIENGRWSVSIDILEKIINALQAKMIIE